MLILDDDAAVGQTIQWIAESLGFEAEFVTSPDKFFERLETFAPEIITIDLVMPTLDGVEIMRLLAERKCKARIVISSGMGTRVLDAAERSASQHGLDIAGVISKPITKEALRLLVGEGSEPKQPAAADKHSAHRDEVEITKSALQGALDRHEFVMAYQPKIECKSGAPAGFEALVRWKHPTMGIVMPDHFIPVAEGVGLIDELTVQIFDQSLAWFSNSFANSKLKLSLNISARSLVDIHLADVLTSLCREYLVAPERVVLELTESSAMVDPILSLDLLTRLRVKGFQLSIDDFGTGYSSMVQLVRLPFSEIKVDRSFVMQAEQSQESRTVIKSIVDLGHSLGLVVTAEGVEDLSTLNYLNSLGCDLAQGYFIARPMAGEAARAWVEKR
jgi:EAL domain-containing protein (putative c-di-GMP-specific phosphodiesterase class I)